jgi:formylglycine-generating enzyme required for sulfatase activity
MKKLSKMVMLMCLTLAAGCTVVLQEKSSGRSSSQTTSSGDISPAPLVSVPEGWFIMGDDNGEDDEKPAHRVWLDAYQIEKYEVSATQFAVFLNSVKDLEKFIQYIEFNCSDCTVMYGNGRYFARQGYETRPANYVSWYGADAYCRYVGRRLPTEAEWEKAARGEDGRKYPWGNEEPDNNHKLEVYDYENHIESWTDMKAVDSLSAGKSPYGAHHMAGNVWEWVADWYAMDYYKQNIIRNPKGASSGEYRLIKGSSWSLMASSLRSAPRNYHSPEARYSVNGCRCAK